jgi:Syntaxin
LISKAKNALAYIEARHEDIKRIEASIQQLHQLFVDILILLFLFDFNLLGERREKTNFQMTFAKYGNSSRGTRRDVESN